MKRLKNIKMPIGIIFLLLLIPISRAFSDNLFFNGDLWFLFNHGQYVLEHGIPTIEPFTMHENFSFVMQQWLCSVMFYLVFSLFGKIGFSIFIVLIFVLMLFIIYKLCLLMSNKNEYLSVIILVASSLVLLPFIVGRPQIFSYVNLLLLLYCLECYIHKKDKRYLIALPIISIIQINIHSAMWWMLLCFTLPYIIGGIKPLAKKFNNETYNLKPLIFAVMAMLLAGLINPYGLEMITYLFKSYGIYEINHFITEMMVPDIRTNFGVCIFLTIAIILLILHKAKKIKVRYILLLLGTLYLTLTAYRNYPLFIIASIIALADTFKEILKKQPQVKLPRYANIICYGVIIVITIVSFITISVYKYNKPDLARGATEYLLSHVDKNIVLYTGYDDGGYLEYYGFKPYIDPRAEVFLKSNNKQEDIFNEYYRLQNGQLLPSEFINKYSFTHFVVSADDVMHRYLKQDNHYKLVYEDEYRYVFVRDK